MNAENIIYNSFIKPFSGKNKGNVGTELEFPLINKGGGDIDVTFVSSVTEFLETKGFRCVLYGTSGEKLFMENDAGDCLSFDNSYNNFEFAMHYGDNLCSQYDRFCGYLDMVQNYLEKQNHALLGRGTNPNYGKISVHHVPFSTYDMVQKYLAEFPCRHEVSDFPAFLSSVQTHLDIDEKTLPFAYTVFSQLDFVRGLLFHNSPDFFGKGHRIFRDFLWDKSAFGYCPNITGTPDEVFETTDDLVAFFLKKGMFNHIRDGKYQVFEPVAIKKYFESDDAREEDIDCYLSFCNVEITRRGTLEVRSDCAQSFERAFSPPAFNSGILYELDAASERLEKFKAENGIILSNSQLRAIVAEGKSIDLIAPESEINALCSDLTDIALSGLRKRSKSEEKLLF